MWVTCFAQTVAEVQFTVFPDGSEDPFSANDALIVGPDSILILEDYSRTIHLYQWSTGILSSLKQPIDVHPGVSFSPSYLMRGQNMYSIMSFGIPSAYVFQQPTIPGEMLFTKIGIVIYLVGNSSNYFGVVSDGSLYDLVHLDYDGRKIASTRIPATFPTAAGSLASFSAIACTDSMVYFSNAGELLVHEYNIRDQNFGRQFDFRSKLAEEYSISGLQKEMKNDMDLDEFMDFMGNSFENNAHISELFIYQSKLVTQIAKSANRADFSILILSDISSKNIEKMVKISHPVVDLAPTGLLLYRIHSEDGNNSLGLTTLNNVLSKH